MIQLENTAGELVTFGKSGSLLYMDGEVMYKNFINKVMSKLGVYDNRALYEINSVLILFSCPHPKKENWFVFDIMEEM